MIIRDFEATLGPRCLELTRLTLAWASSGRRGWGAGYRDAGTRAGHLPTARGFGQPGEETDRLHVHPGRAAAKAARLRVHPAGTRGPPAPGTRLATCWGHFKAGCLAPSWPLSSASARCRFGIGCCAAVLLGFFCEDCDLPCSSCSADSVPLKRRQTRGQVRKGGVGGTLSLGAPPALF